MKTRLDKALVERGAVTSRSQAESFIRMKRVSVNKQPATKPGQLVTEQDIITVEAEEQYVSRAGYKLESVAQQLNVSFKDAVVLDVGSSTGGFTDYALKNGAAKIIAVDVGTDQLHPRLQGDERIDLREKTDIRSIKKLEPKPTIVVIDVSFISLREILPHIAKLASRKTETIAMLKPQFEAGADTKHKGVIKNDKMRRQILKDFEAWVKQYFVIIDKADSAVSGSKGNQERFYKLKLPVK